VRRFNNRFRGEPEILSKVVLIIFAFGLVFIIIISLPWQLSLKVFHPFIILTVPMAVAGALFSLWLFDQTWNIFSQIKP
jgi:multidrug efflux pump subunit AcrB